MSVTVTHPEYDARVEEWSRISAVLAGRDAIIDAGEQFVPMLNGQTPEQYRSFLVRGLFFNGTHRTRKGIVGLVFAQDAQVSTPKLLEPMLEDVTLNDTSLNEFAKEIFSETIAYNWGGILVDVPPIEEITSAGENRPYVVFYHATRVRWWKQERIAGRLKTTCVILQEKIEQPLADDPYGSEYIDQYRVLKLERVEDGRKVGYIYKQEEWREIEITDPNNKDRKIREWVLINTIIPERRKKPLDFIPFTFTTTEGTDPHICKSELLDLIDVNIDHWRLSVDLRHGLHFTALPTPCAAGIPDALDLKIGSEVAWTSTDPQFKWGFLEFSGAGIKSIQDAIERDEHLMALLGSRLLETQKRASETAEAMVIRQAGEDSVVMSAAKSIEKALEKALWHMAWWLGDEDPKVSVSLTSSMNDLLITTADMVVIMKSYLAGLISEKSFLEAFIRKGYITGKSWEEEAALPKIETPIPIKGDGTSSGAGNSIPTMDRGTVNLPSP